MFKRDTSYYRTFMCFIFWDHKSYSANPTCDLLDQLTTHLAVYGPLLSTILSHIASVMFSVVLFIYSHRIPSHKYTLCLTHRGLRASETLTNNSFLGCHSNVFEVWAGGSLVTFEQPFHLWRAEQAQGVLPRLNLQLEKSPASNFQGCFPKNKLNCSAARILMVVNISLPVRQLQSEACGFAKAGWKEPCTVWRSSKANWFLEVF